VPGHELGGRLALRTLLATRRGTILAHTATTATVAELVARRALEVLEALLDLGDALY
jgi:hypothetical protein